MHYAHLIIATGSRARRIPLPGIDLANVLELRTAADADKLKAVLGPGKRLAVVGGGYIGLEAAASARALGAEVTIIELAPRVSSPASPARSCPTSSRIFTARRA